MRSFIVFCLVLSAVIIFISPISMNDVRKHFRRMQCGPDIGSCPGGQCCSEKGMCGRGVEFCGIDTCIMECYYPEGPPGESTEHVRRPKIGKVHYGEVISRCKAPNTLALTFDDGPSHLTDQLLDLLDKHQVKATFFITGGKKGRGRIDDPSLPWASVLHRMYESGHQIASHTWAHQKFHKLNNTMRRREIIYNEMAFRNLLGLIPTYIRVPFFGYDEAGLNYLGKLGYHVIDANLVPRDWAPGSPRERFLKGLDLNRTSYIALAHDIFPESVFGLAEYMITRARDSGLRVVTVGECMGDPKKNWYRKAGGPLTVQPNATSLEYPPN